MKKNTSILIAVIVVVVLIVGGYAIFHKSNKNTPASSTTTTSSASVSNAVLATKTSSSLGQYLAEPNGMTLYTYGGDSSGVSHCMGSCLATWPAYQDKGSTTNLPAGVSTIRRTDNGETQYTYQGMPLYTFVGDSKGQVTGNGVSNFTIAHPATTTTSSSTPTSSSSTSSSSSSGW